MNKQRIAAYLNLIKQLLDCPSGEPLQVRTREAFPEYGADSQNLGEVYRNRICGERSLIGISFSEKGAKGLLFLSLEWTVTKLTTSSSPKGGGDKTAKV